MAARKKAAAETETPPEPAPKVEKDNIKPITGGLEVDLSEPDDDDDAPDPEETELSRREKKQRRQSLREENQRLRERELDLERQNGQLLGYAQGVQQQAQPQQQQGDPFAAEEEGLNREEDLLIQEYRLNASKMTDEQERALRKKGKDIQRRQQELNYRRVEAQRGGNQPQNPVMQTLQARYPDIMQNPAAFRHALARYQIAVTHPDPEQRLADDWGTADRIMNETRQEFGMMPREGREERHDTRREGPVPRRYEGAAAGAGSGGKTKERVSVQLTALDVANADAAWPHLDQKARYTKMAEMKQKNQKTG